MNRSLFRHFSRVLPPFLCGTVIGLGLLISGGSAPAHAACVYSGDAAVSSSNCDSSQVYYYTGSGNAVLTVDSTTTQSVLLQTTNSSVSNINQTLNLIGNTTINNPSYSGVIMQSNSLNRNLWVNIGANVNITSGGGFGAVWLLNDGSGDIVVDNSGTATANAGGGPGISAITNGGFVNINNTGTSTSVDNWGIYADGGYTDTSPVLVSVTNTGSVSGYLAGIRTINYNGLSTIENSGTVVSETRQGLVSWSANGDAGIINTGSVTSGDDNAIHVMSETGNVGVNNSGTLTASDDALITAVRTGYSGIRATVNTSGSVFILNSDTGVINAEDDFGIVGETPSGDVYLYNLGTINALSGISAFSGDGDIVMTNEGTINAVDKGVVISGVESLLTNNGVIATSGSVAVETGSGDTTIVNNGTISAGSAADTAISFGAGDNRLVINAGSVIIGRVTGSTGTNTLELTGTGTASIDASSISDSGQYQDFDTVEKTGSGTWVVTGVSTDVDWVLNGGLLSINGSVSNVSVNTGTLSGSGNYGAITVDSGGVLAPGNSIGTMHLTDLTFASGSSFEVEIDADGNSDRVDAAGAVTINSGSGINIIPESGSGTGSDYNPFTTYTIISSADGVTGTFDTVTDGFAFLDVELRYSANTVYMDMMRNNMEFRSLTKTKNAASVASAIEDAGISNALYRAVLPLSENGVQNAFALLSGEVYASAQTMLLDDTRFVSESVLARKPFEGREASVWVNIIGSKADWDGGDGTSTLSRTLGGAVIGLERAFGQTLGAGLVFGIGNSDFDVDGMASSGSVNSYYIGAYAEKQMNKLALTLGGILGRHSIETDRSVYFGSYSDKPEAEYDADSYQLFGEVAYDIAAKRGKISPYAGLAYVNLDTDGFSEDGGTAALTAGSADMKTVYGTFGLRGETYAKAGNADITLSSSVAVRHAFGDVTPAAELSLAGTGSFTVEGAPLARNTAVFGLGIDGRLSSNTSLGISYNGQFASAMNDQSIKADLKIKF
ncbi:autotransporter outer membrane beta-barrel domain-containing protein [Seleniivibrio woodruffii]|uniref:autotransporter outer membrane beta-barrel domain-containing protein n=1 Tax=Seleniivibrio woodruffii TaxID=1078050 RepID=UPI00240A137C|nr:autotransporter domain-containing protein [Seleniivibrio woodruffii]